MKKDRIKKNASHIYKIPARLYSVPPSPYMYVNYMPIRTYTYYFHNLLTWKGNNMIFYSWNLSPR